MGLGIAVQVSGSTDSDLSEASSVEVYERMGEPTRFRLSYALSISEGDLPLLKDSRIEAGAELAVVVPIEGQDQVLVRGPVCGQRIQLVHGGSESWVEVEGRDLSIAMNREMRAEIYSGVSASDVVRTILDRYGLQPDVEDTDGQFTEEKHALVQRDTDLRFVRRLAQRCGFQFWVTASADGTATAHFRRPKLDGEPAALLKINSDAPNLAQLNLDWDVERPTTAVATQLSLNDKSDIDGQVARSPLGPLGAQGLLDITGDTRTVQIVAPVDEAGDLKGRGEGALIDWGWFIRATCETSLRALGKQSGVGKLLRAHSVVELQGAGSRHSGRYYVCGVRHEISASGHIMKLELIRNGWGG